MLAFMFSDIDRFEEHLYSVILVIEGNAKGSLGNHFLPGCTDLLASDTDLSTEWDISATAVPHNCCHVWRTFVFFLLSH